MNNIYNDTNKYDMAIVLGGGILDYDMMNDRIIFRQNTDRIVQVVELYKMGKVKKILISGGNGSLDKDIVPEARLLKRYLYFSGVDSVDIMLEDKSNNTYQNALYCNEILKEKEYYGKSMLLITSAYHMRRAVKCFERQGIKVIPYSTDKYSPNDFVIDIRQVLIPSIRAMYLWNQLFHEWVGCMVYYIMGYI